MTFLETELEGVLIVERKAFGDARGHFMELARADALAARGIGPFVQDNFSRSARGVLRGLHFQEPRPQGKFVTALAGAVIDVAVDIRRGSPTFGKHVAVELSDQNHRSLWVPPGFAHGFCVLGDGADVLYKCTEYFVPEADRGIVFSDPDLAIQWPLAQPLVSPKDAAAPRLRDAPALPAYKSTL